MSIERKQLTEVKEEIVQYFHCALCFKEVPAGQSPQTYQRIQAGFTKKGIQVWCVRHDKNIIHLDFQGQKVAVAS